MVSIVRPSGGSATFPISGDGVTVTASTPLLNLTQTWNNAGVTFTGLKFNATDTASGAASLLLDLQASGASQFTVSKGGAASATAFFIAPTIYANHGGTNTDFVANGNYVSIAAAVPLGFAPTANADASPDVVLRRDAADTLALRRGVNSQAFNLYETYTDASNYSKVTLTYDGVSGRYKLVSSAAGTGTTRGVGFGPGGEIWAIVSTGHLLTTTDNTYDIGASGATRPRSIYVGTNITTGNQLNVGGGSGLGTTATTTTFALFGASTTGVSSLRLTQGVAPTSPVDGDVWREDNTNTGLKIRINGVTKTFTLI